MTITKKVTNGVSFGATYTAVAQDASDGEIILDFGAEYAIVALIQVQDGSGVNVALADAVITYPGNGQVSIANGGATFTITTGYVFNVIANRAV